MLQKELLGLPSRGRTSQTVRMPRIKAQTLRILGIAGFLVALSVKCEGGSRRVRSEEKSLNVCSSFNENFLSSQLRTRLCCTWWPSSPYGACITVAERDCTQINRQQGVSVLMKGLASQLKELQFYPAGH